MTAPHVYVQSDIPDGVTINAWRCGRRRQATSSTRARVRAALIRTARHLQRGIRPMRSQNTNRNAPWLG